MYSKKTYAEAGYSITPPPGYDGSRFRRRSDGRDDTFPPYDRDYQQSTQNNTIDHNEEKPEKNVEKDKKHIGGEELLIIALIIALASEEKPCFELILMLALLLCV